MVSASVSAVLLAQTGTGAPQLPASVPDTGATIKPGATYTPPPPTPAIGTDMNASAPAVALQAPGMDATTSSRYRLQPGDALTVRYRLTPEYNQSVTLQPEGTVTLRLLGPVPLEGLTAAEARARIQELAAKRLLHPELSIDLTNVSGPHFTVLGQVGKPGRYALRGPLTVEDALAIAGGLTVEARHTRIVLVHRISETIGSTQLIDVRQFEKKAKPGTELVSMQPDDILVVPKSKLANVEL